MRVDRPRRRRARADAGRPASRTCCRPTTSASRLRGDDGLECRATFSVGLVGERPRWPLRLVGDRRLDARRGRSGRPSCTPGPSGSAPCRRAGRCRRRGRRGARRGRRPAQTAVIRACSAAIPDANATPRPPSSVAMASGAPPASGSPSRVVVALHVSPTGGLGVRGRLVDPRDVHGSVGPVRSGGPAWIALVSKRMLSPSSCSRASRNSSKSERVSTKAERPRRVWRRSPLGGRRWEARERHSLHVAYVEPTMGSGGATPRRRPPPCPASRGRGRSGDRGARARG